MQHRRHTSLLTALATLLVLAAAAARAAEPTVVELTQTGCQFVEVETADHGYATRKAEDCEAINARSGDGRLAASKTIALKPGKYVFRVTNRNVPYELGFWLRGDGLISRATLPSVSGGGLTEGKTQDYEIKLVAGEYVYSCPLNPTPNYRLVVSEG
ncbi:MAG: hypothetical protein RIM84_20450 [Alphaproteobacteria bacterium]